MKYFVVMIDYGRRGREAVVDPEVTRRELVSRVASGEYRNISFIHEVVDRTVDDVRKSWPKHGFPMSRHQRPTCRQAGSITSGIYASTRRPKARYDQA
jgi:hypothetical protein